MKIIGAIFAFTLLVVGTSAYASTGKTCSDPHLGIQYREGITVAMNTSWYGPGFHGKQTASGKIFDQHNPQMAAHKVLPLGTIVNLRNPINGKMVKEVVILDDGPHPRGRHLDASQAAAEALGFINSGVTQLEVTIIQMADSECRDDGKGLR